MKIFFKILMVIFFGIFGLAYNFSTPALYEILISWKTKPYPYMDSGDNDIWPYFILGGLFFSCLWAWNGICLLKSPLNGLYQCLATIAGSLIFFLISYNFWPVLGSSKSQSATIWFWHILTWILTVSVFIWFFKMANHRNKLKTGI